MRAALEVVCFIIDKYPQRPRYAKTYTVNALLKIFELQQLEQKKIALQVLLVLLDDEAVFRVFSSLRGVGVLVRAHKAIKRGQNALF